MSALENLLVDRPSPMLADSADLTSLPAALLRLQTPPPLQTRLRPLPTLQALCLQAVCDRCRRRPLEPGPHWGLGDLPPPLARLAADTLWADLPPLDSGDPEEAEDLALLAEAVVTRHTRIGWLRPNDSTETVRRLARALRRRPAELREVHIRSAVSHRLVDVFLDEFLSEPATGLHVIAGRPPLDDCRTLIEACPSLTHLYGRTPTQFSLEQLRSQILTCVDLETNVTVDLRVVTDCTPALRRLRVATWYKCSPSRRPLLLAPVEAAGAPCCPRLEELEVSGYQLGASLQARLPQLRALSLVRCSAPLAGLFGHPELRRLKLQNVDSDGGALPPGAELPQLAELELHTAWGGRRRIDVSAVNACCPALRRLTLRPDYYQLVRGGPAGARGWFPHLEELTVLWLTEDCCPPEALFGDPLPRLRHLTMRRHCWLFADLLSESCPQLETLDLTSAKAGPAGAPLRRVRRLVARLCAERNIRDICERLPELRQAEIHLGYVDHMVAAGYRRLVDQLTERGVQVTVVED
ncbi:hypothetical protein FJT64_010484 [Amphibalanus amphitrite]|uniref:Uncharacterized protein n=1 Tax=Amphibalanus amphitrite TaxID=1232801 RepID=A0A6A4VMB6_AMPAM|nr:hypothetical protein FJT64_010484 [Amphibalanus amphitrite]